MINKKSIHGIEILLIFIILSILSSIFLFHTHYLFGAGDMQFHLKRIIELETSFKHGNLFPTFSFNQFHGSAVLALYPYLNLFPIILLSLFIKSNIVLIYIFFGLNIFISLLISYYSSLNLSESGQVSILFAITYSLSIPFLAYGFYNMDLGVLTSISVFPLVVFGFLSLLKDNKWIMLAIGLTLVILSHVLSTIIIIGFCLLFTLFNYKKIADLRFWKDILKACCLILLLASIVWIPALKLSLNNLTSIYPTNLFLPSRISFLFLLKDGVFNYITYNLGIIALIGIILPWIMYPIFYKRFNRFTKQMYWIAIIVIITCSSPIWSANYGVFKVLRIFQFAWRFYIIPETLLCYVVSVCASKCIRYINVRCIMFWLFIILAIGTQFLGQERLIHESIHSPSITQNYIDHNTYTKETNVHHLILPLKQFHFVYYKNPRYPYYKVTNEKQLFRLTNIYTDQNTPDYYPIRSLSKVNDINNNKGIYDNHHTLNVRHRGYNQFGFSNKNSISKLALPLLHYHKEDLRLYLDSHLVPYSTNRNDLITISHVKKGNHRLGVQYIPNVWQIILESVLFVLGILWLIWIWIKNLLNKKFGMKNVNNL